VSFLDAYWSYVQKALVFAAIAGSFYALGRLASSRIMRAKFLGDVNLLRSIAKLTSLTLTIIGLLLALASIGVSLSGLLAAAGFTGIVVGLAAQQTLGNLIAGLILLFEGRAKIGDVVRVGESMGVVETVSLISTQVRLFTGELMTVPNQVLMSSSLVNVSSARARRIDVNIGISYSSSIEKARQAILAYLEAHPYVLAYPRPVVMVDSLGDSSVNLKVLLWVPAEKWFEVRSTVVGDLKAELEKSGVEIPFPQRVVWLKQ